jgi:hypothetical protein
MGFGGGSYKVHPVNANPAIGTISTRIVLLGYGQTVKQSFFAGAGATHCRHCPFRKFHPAWIRMIGQNHRMVVGDDRDPAFSRNVYHRSVQVAQPA